MGMFVNPGNEAFAGALPGARFTQPQPRPFRALPQSQTESADAPDKMHKTDTSDSVPVFRYRNTPESLPENR